MIDADLKSIISILNENGIKTLACCSGHGVYPVTIVAEIKGFPVELFTGIRIPRKKKFYKLEKETGFYYIPETLGKGTIYR